MEAFDIGAVVLLILVGFEFLLTYRSKKTGSDIPPAWMAISPLQFAAGMVILAIVVIQTSFMHNNPDYPSWSTMRPIVKEASAFRHRPPIIAADWRRLQAEHRLTGDQWVAFKSWVDHEKEARDKRVVEQLTANRAPTRACQPTACRSSPERRSAHDVRDRGN